MLTCENADIRLCIHERGSELQLIDKQRGQAFSLDTQTLLDRGLTPNRAVVESGGIVLECTHNSGTVRFHYALGDGFVEVSLPSDTPTIERIPLPGSFSPIGERKRYVLPIMQGMLWDGRGEVRDEEYREGGHGGFAMAMYGLMGDRGALMMTAETADDCAWRIGKDGDGRTWVTNEQIPSLGTTRYGRVARLYLVDASITAIAKSYRARVVERGRFKSWEEKLRERPELERLFGALMCFLGYCQDDLDYAAECEKLKAQGFDRALIYPVRFNTYSEDFLMGGHPPINMSHETVEKITSMGYDVAPWSWINEGIDDGSADMHSRYRADAEGKRKLGWQIDGHKWYTCCTGPMAQFQRDAVNGRFSDMTWDHFDVITCATNNECYALDHDTHEGRPLSRTEDRQFIRDLLLAGQAGKRAVSSESFNDAYSMEYDLGSVKAWAQYGPWPYWPIPLTMLVYHDSMMHTWWENHNYNNHYGSREMRKYQYGGGRPRLMSAMDALYGSIPDVFPFGAKYGWTGKGKETFLYKKRFEDPEVQYALSLAKPVAELHRRIGKLEMTEFEFLSDDGYLQKTAFADGTMVYANLGYGARFVDGIGSIQTQSWVAVYPEE